MCLFTDIRQKLRVTMVNALELEEAGYGEGVFREFLSELIKEAFDPNRGLFCRTEQQELYPNPQVKLSNPVMSCCIHGYGAGSHDYGGLSTTLLFHRTTTRESSV